MSHSEYTSTQEIVSSSRTNSVSVEVVKPPPEKVPKLAETVISGTNVKPAIQTKLDTQYDRLMLHRQCHSTGDNVSETYFLFYNFRPLDSRLSKSIPSKTQSLAAASNTNTSTTAQSNTAETRNTATATIQPAVDRQLIFTTGKAIPFRGTHTKTVGSVRVHIINEHMKTPLGALSKIYAVRTVATSRQQQQQPYQALWEILIGSAVVNFALTARYVIICSVDGTVRVLDAQTGVQTLPLLKLPTPAVQCCFVSVSF